jgi:hypothetical protein
MQTKKINSARHTRGTEPNTGNVSVGAKATAALMTLVVFLFGCSKSDSGSPDFQKGSGDITAFVLQSAVSFGARPVKTNGLPKMEGEWQYKKEQEGIQIYVVGDKFNEVQGLLREAFGPPTMAPTTNLVGKVTGGMYASGSVGAAIQYLRDDRADGTHYAEVLIARAAESQAPKK